MTVNEEECRAAGLDPRAVAQVARRLERAAKDAASMGLIVFGGMGSGTLRVARSEVPGSGKLIVAHIYDGSWDGGYGGYSPGLDGLERGES